MMNISFLHVNIKKLIIYNKSNSKLSIIGTTGIRFLKSLGQPDNNHYFSRSFFRILCYQR